MSKGLRIAAVGAALVASAVLIPGAAAGDHSSDGEDGDGRTLQFDVEFSPTSYTDLGDPGFSPADVIVFDDELLEDGEQVGHEIGVCAREHDRRRELHGRRDPRRPGDHHVRVRELPGAGEDPRHHRRTASSGPPAARAPSSKPGTTPEP